MSRHVFDTDALHRRGKALEDEFFHRVDEKLRAALRLKMQREEALEQLKAATGFQDDELLEHLHDAGVTPASIAAMALVPVVFVAWADGRVTTAERQAVFSSALHRGLKEQPSAFDLLMAWLDKRPDEGLWDLWQEYFGALHQTLQPSVSQQLESEVLRSATMVAEASGGRFEKGEISDAERSVLDQIRAAFQFDSP